MSVILILILASLAVALGFLGAFVWSVRSGQFDDLTTPALRMLTDDGTLEAEETRAAARLNRPPSNPQPLTPNGQ